ncbi:hypothetical protein ACJIZ3_024828 [Penstemon smallii]|uniref:Filament-like plant protein 4 n=1 Tax=Penstemon smallii TaxID=265156 RepID=A0ABD3TTY0_9LAMI
MDRRSWPWKKKSSDKQAADKAAAIASDSSTAASDIDKDNNKKPKYVQISMDSYTRLTGLEDQVKSYEEQVKTLEDEVKEVNEKLSEAHSEMSNKEVLVKQHAKVAEEAVSGWEKAEAEAAALKNHLESVTLLKLTAEDRASHLDGALKECMRQIRNLKEEHDQNVHEVVLNRAKLFDKMKHELETKIASFDQQLQRSAADNAALSRSLQERSNMLLKLSEEKSQAEAEIEFLKSNIESYEKEVNSLKYEVHIARKEVEIRNEEKNMSERSSEVANKQHLEGVKKIAKLEAECQRLRGLVRKKLPGPAALAQMKLEVESLGYGESRLRRSPVRPPSPQMSQLPEFYLDNAQNYQKENELLTERILAMEEETKMLKEALAKRNSELLSSRSIYAQTASKLQSLEAQLQSNGEYKILPRSNSQVPVEGFCSKKASNAPSVTSMSEDGNDDNVSCAGSWATVSMSELSHSKKEKNVNRPHKSDSTNNLDLMDDFLEMEKLAYLTNGTNGMVSSNVKHEPSLEVITTTDSRSGETHGQELQVSSKEDVTVENTQLQADQLIFVELQSKISLALESMSKEKDMEKVIVGIRHVMQDMHDTLHLRLVNGVVKAAHSSGTISAHKTLAEDGDVTATKEESLSADCNSSIASVKTSNQELENALSQIYDFVMILGKETKSIPTASPDGDGLNSKLNMLSVKYRESIKSEINLIEFVLDISHVLSEASELQFNVLGFKGSALETGNSDCIDKIALPENKVSVDSLGERYQIGCSNFSDLASDPDVPNDVNLVPTSESRATTWKCSLEEFEQLKMDKDNLTVDLARSTENFESTKAQLAETEQLLADAKAQLVSAQKSNSLAETQLKCIAESYRSLETRAEQLQTEVNLLQGKIEGLDNELQEERRNHQDALTKCKDLQEQLQRRDSCSAAEIDDKTGQVRLIREGVSWKAGRVSRNHISTW